MNQAPLSKEEVENFDRDGVLVARGFYDVPTQILPIQQQIHQLIGAVIAQRNLDIEQAPFTPETFDSGYQPLIAHDRSLGGLIYDAVKQIPAFIRLVACEKHQATIAQLRNSSCVGVAAGGYGIRIDNPAEERFRANWHQDYHAQLRSMDGLVFWSPLLPVSAEIGPVEFCLGSHQDGPRRVTTVDPNNQQKAGAYALTLINEAQVVGQYGHAAPLTDPGDLVIVDYQTIHRSGRNDATRSRWSMQMRMFNFEEPQGRSIGWRGAYATGTSLKDVHPELISDGEAD
ncbi:MAG: phytanoyl-CoA dioxygenase family protein [Phycisphaeraceae bacterium]|nr:phytanoyl-CoA dioxygenase family protein [Phycisphaeraceae bacterium]